MPLTDLEICKRLAEIENYKGWEKMSTRGIQGVFNPLTDDGLCFRLMYKHKMYIADAYREHPCKYSVDTGKSVIFDDSPNKAICLAIIESHKDN